MPGVYRVGMSQSFKIASAYRAERAKLLLGPANALLLPFLIL